MPSAFPSSPAGSQQFLHLAQQMADALGLDVTRVARGDRMVYNGLTFWLRHHGAADPHGLVLVVMAGPCKDFGQTFLRHHYMTPAAVTGYYAMLPESDDVVYCTRIDFERTAQPLDAILACVQLTADCTAAASRAVASQAPATHQAPLTPKTYA